MCARRISQIECQLLPSSCHMSASTKDSLDQARIRASTRRWPCHCHVLARLLRNAPLLYLSGGAPEARSRAPHPSPSRSRQRIVMTESLPTSSPLRTGTDNSSSSIRSSCHRQMSMTTSQSPQMSNVRRGGTVSNCD